MSSPTLLWWTFLCTVSVINIVAWATSAAVAQRRANGLSPETLRMIRWQIALSAGYVLGCAYRSAFPVYDVQRQVIVDSWMSSVVVGRSVATIAELCFAAQWALLMHAVSRDTRSLQGMRVSKLIVPMIVTAEVFSWYSVLTTSNIGHVFEESLWGLCALMLVASLVAQWPRCQPSLRPLLAATCVVGTTYAIYMFQVDVPMYWTRWVQETERGHQTLSLLQGLMDTSSRWIVTHRWADWEGEVMWMSLYFSVAVWLSISLMHLPMRFAMQSSATPGSRGQARLHGTS